MPPADADAAVDPHSTPPTSPSIASDSRTAVPDGGTSTGNEETLELRLSGELLTLYEAAADLRTRETHPGTPRGTGPTVPHPDAAHPDVSSLNVASAELSCFIGGARSMRAGASSTTSDDLLDHVAHWDPVSTPLGTLELVPVRVDRDIPLISRWMNDPAVAEFWELAGAPEVTEEHVRSQLSGDGRSVPCLGVLDGTPMSYWEIYRADLDPLARCYPARPHDTGLHLLVGDAADRGHGLGGALIRAVSDLVLDNRPACPRVVAEPDLRNTPSVSAFLTAGFRYSAEVDLPAKRAALMIRERALRHLL
ncbi:GNAT family N-acetyltransferase [Streptomyces sp. NPDC096080]|uniref:GNAT family N-acetyltransferase n=1 Tax=Streptomyces sp. NPDC096080 TaxID=3156693 RepID=UPI00332A88F7